MANKELRKMNHTELIEIIYALQQNDRILRQENEELKAKLEDKTIRLEESGSIAEAALSLNHVFEEAQAAADQYLRSVKEYAARTGADPGQTDPGQGEAAEVPGEDG